MDLTFFVVMVFIAALVIFAVLDIAMLVTLLRPGDERNQIIVWKASSFTLISVVGCLILEVIENFARAQSMVINPFVHLEVIAIVYFISLVYYKRKLGG